MGLTFNCCRCHDHKVDPLTHADYYRLRAFFEGVKPNDDIALDLPAGQAVIQRETLAIEQAQQAVADIENPAFRRLRDARRAALPEEKKKLLALPEEDQNDYLREQIRLTKKSIEPSSEKPSPASTPPKKPRVRPHSPRSKNYRASALLQRKASSSPTPWACRCRPAFFTRVTSPNLVRKSCQEPSPPLIPIHCLPLA